jgi:5-methylcytosine-specific restriction endonuclease McrA
MVASGEPGSFGHMTTGRPVRTRKARAARRRNRRVAASASDLTAQQWQALLQAWAACAYCGAQGCPLQRDCVLPISRGGRYTLDNVVPACRSCNASKCNEEVTSWMRRRRLDEPTFLRRWLEVTASLRSA